MARPTVQTRDPDPGEVPAAEKVPVMTVPRAGRILGIGRSAAYAAAASGQLPTIRLGGRLLVPTARLRALVGLPAE